jgi:hypothetical protein
MTTKTELTAVGMFNRTFKFSFNEDCAPMVIDLMTEYASLRGNVMMVRALVHHKYKMNKPADDLNEPTTAEI